MPSLAEAFWSALGISRADDALEPRLESIVATAKRSWLEITLDERDFCAHLAKSVGHLDDLSTLEALHVGDLFLACACARGNHAALRIFNEQFLSSIDRSVAKVDGSAHFADEVRQNVREELLVAPQGRPPKIAAYSGRG